MSETPILSPGRVATHLFAISPDRDEHASQICTELLLTLLTNGFVCPEDDQLKSPKLKRFALRSLVFGWNFLEGQSGTLPGTNISVIEYGSMLANGEDFQGSENIDLARTALRNLVDLSTAQGQIGQHLLMPFHEALLWYDARSSSDQYTVRKIRMRGSGITFARMLLNPPKEGPQDIHQFASRALAGIKKALAGESPLAVAANALERVLPPDITALPRKLEDDEIEAWRLGGDELLSRLAYAICQHSDGVMAQRDASTPEKLWQFRTIIAFEFDIHTLRQSWAAVGTAENQQFLLLALPGGDRQRDRVRLRSERSYSDARRSIRWATIHALEEVMTQILAVRQINWDNDLDGRTRKVLEQVVVQPYENEQERDLSRVAQLIFENASYERSGEGFRVLIESIGMSAGGTRYRYLSATPDLMSALVGALSAEMPMTSGEFFSRLRSEWNIVISPGSSIGTILSTDLDGAELAANSRRFENLLIEAGLASGLSDRTVLVGEKAGRRHN